MKGEDIHSQSAKRDELPLSMLIPVLILAALCIIVGIFWLIEMPLPVFDQINALFGLGEYATS